MDREATAVGSSPGPGERVPGREGERTADLGVGTSLESLEVTIDALDLEASSLFWRLALGYVLLYERPPYVVLGPPSGSGPRVLVQRVEAVPAHSRVHLDLRVQDPAGDVRRLESLGATVQRVVEEAGTAWTVMLDPAGTPFCVCPAREGP